MKAIIYPRFSPRPNGRESTSDRDQIAQCLEWCEKNRIAVRAGLDGEFADREVSGGNTSNDLGDLLDLHSRPGLVRAVEALHGGDVLLAYDQYRFARDGLILAYIEKMVHTLGCRIGTVHQGIFSNDPAHRLLRQVEAFAGELERENIRRRTSERMQLHQKNGRVMSSKLPYGYQEAEPHVGEDGKITRRLIPHEGEQAAISRMKQLRSEGLSYRAVADVLEREGHPNRGNGFNSMLVSRALRRHDEGE